MANVIITIKIMPESVDIELSSLKEKAIREIRSYAKLKEDEEIRAEIEPIAFGLNALKIAFVMNENIGSTEPLEKSLSAIEGVNSVDVIDVRRAVG